MAVNLGATSKPLRWEDSIAIAATSDCFLTPDSSMHAFGAALGIPVVSLWGSFSPDIRIIKGSKGEAIKGKGVCPMAPCNHHTGCGVQWPTGGPCNQSGVCDELASINPERVINEVERMCRLGRKRDTSHQPSVARVNT
jgi:ADP-heptose:LPS heptosyltransferase